MSVHDDIANAVRKSIIDADDRDRRFDLSPTLIAQRVFSQFQLVQVDPHTEWGAIEGFKAVARKVLADRYEPEAQDSRSYQDDMFSGLLQERYPMRRTAGAEPTYRHIDDLSEADLAWNVELLRKSALARQKHADALAAFARKKFKRRPRRAA